MPVIVGAKDMIKKGTDKHINEILGSSSLYEMQKNFTLPKLVISLGENYQFEWKSVIQTRCVWGGEINLKKKNT